jgi:hypothetical protein
MRAELLRLLSEIRRRTTAGDFTGIALVCVARTGRESVIACVGTADGGNDAWCDALEELRAHIVSDDVLPLPDGPGGDPSDKAN